jgi:hypothetical protein
MSRFTLFHTRSNTGRFPVPILLSDRYAHSGPSSDPGSISCCRPGHRARMAQHPMFQPSTTTQERGLEQSRVFLSELRVEATTRGPCLGTRPIALPISGTNRALDAAQNGAADEVGKCQLLARYVCSASRPCASTPTCPFRENKQEFLVLRCRVTLIAG